MARGPTWTDDDNARLTGAWGGGISDELIGEALSRTPAAVRAQARRLGLPTRTRELVDRSGWTKVLVELPDELLPAKGKRGDVIREALRWRESGAAMHLQLTIYQQWARGLTGAYDEPDEDLRTTIEGLIKSPGGPWRERVERLGNVFLEGIDDATLWRLALEYTTKEPTAIVRALLAAQLGVDQRGRTLSELLSMVEKPKRR